MFVKHRPVDGGAVIEGVADRTG